MEIHYSRRMSACPPSFLGELFRVSSDPRIISFAGGLPDASLIDVEGIRNAACEVLQEHGREALQYSTTDGYLPLREWIAARYRSRLGIDASPAAIQIVNGSQQCLDLVAKILLNPGDPVGIESPGYLGAIEAFSLYEPSFQSFPVIPSGPDRDSLGLLIRRFRPPFIYGIPNSQNPSGITWTGEQRRMVADLLDGSCTLFYEDDAFGELFFDQRPRPPVSRFLPHQTLMSGSFSKIISPGLRTGWIFAPQKVLEAFNIVKQAADLHSNLLAQMVLHRYLTTVDLDRNLAVIVSRYESNCRLMCDLLDDLGRDGLTHTTPEGGMFMMAFLPEWVPSMELYKKGLDYGVAVLPGVPFHTDGRGNCSVRLNFSNTDEGRIQEGMTRLKKALLTFSTR
jgi:2-aminoadipate transaminase